MKQVREKVRLMIWTSQSFTVAAVYEGERGGAQGRIKII